MTLNHILERWYAICCMQIIPKIPNYDIPSAYKLDGRYGEFIQYIGVVISSKSQDYLQSFDNLVYSVLEGKNWKQKDLETATGMNRQYNK